MTGGSQWWPASRCGKTMTIGLGVPESKGTGGAARLQRWPVGSGPLQRPRGGVKHSDGKNWKPEG